MKIGRFAFLFAAVLASVPALFGCSNSLGYGEPDLLGLEVVVTRLDTPWALDFAPDGRVFITERKGLVRVVRDGELLDEPWMELPVAEEGESGLLGLALDPDFAENHFVYVAYTWRNESGALKNRLVRLVDDPGSDSGRMDIILLDNVRAAGNHDGGRVKFGPDGKLYWTMGDSGNPELARNTTSLNGKILRINPDGSVPDDNPIPGSPVYSWGHRNPQGLAWQPGTGRIYATEHGPSGFQGSGQDEVNYIEPGNDYGWPDITGEVTAEGLVSPVIQSGSTETWAPSGATFVEGGKWDGSLLFVGLRGQSLYRMKPDPDDPYKSLLFRKEIQVTFGRLRDVAQGPDGAIYILTSNRDGRGRPVETDDRLIKVTVE